MMIKFRNAINAGLISCVFILCILVVNSAQAESKLVIRSGVPSDVPNGLYAQYLSYLANQMNMELELTPMPFERRLHWMRTGKIDVMVGMQKNQDEQDVFIYLAPSYESLRHSLFIQKDNTHKLQSFDDLKKLSIGVTKNARYFERFELETDLIMIPVSTLRQKVGLLQKQRIEAFIHFQESALPVLKKMGLENEIVLSDFQTTELNEYFFTLSEKSPLLPYKEKFESVISEGVKRGDFARIRSEYYTGL